MKPSQLKVDSGVDIACTRSIPVQKIKNNTKILGKKELKGRRKNGSPHHVHVIEIEEKKKEKTKQEMATAFTNNGHVPSSSSAC